MTIEILVGMLAIIAVALAVAIVWPSTRCGPARSVAQQQRERRAAEAERETYYVVGWPE